MESTENDPLIASIGHNGQTVMVPQSRVYWRPAAYGLVLNETDLLLVELANGRFVLPGGGIDKGEHSLDAVRREVFEETGVSVKVEQFLTFREAVVYFKREDIAVHTHRFFYECRPMTFDLTNEHNNPEQKDHENPLWVDAKTLTPEMFWLGSHGEMAFEYLRHHQLAE